MKKTILSSFLVFSLLFVFTCSSFAGSIKYQDVELDTNYCMYLSIEPTDFQPNEHIYIEFLLRDRFSKYEIFIYDETDQKVVFLQQFTGHLYNFYLIKPIDGHAYHIRFCNKSSFRINGTARIFAWE